MNAHDHSFGNKCLAATIVLAAACVVGTPTPALAQAAAPENGRAHIFAPWDPARIAERRQQYGLLGPAPTKPYPEPRFPRSLRAPGSVDDMMPGARAAVAQTGGRSPIGLVKRGEHVLIVVPYNADRFVQEAMARALKERGITGTILYEDEAAGVAHEDVVAFHKAQQVFTASDGQQEPADWYFRSIPEPDKTKEWLKAKDAQLYDATFPEFKYASEAQARLARSYTRLVRDGLVKWLDDHPGIDKILWRTGGRPRTRVMLAQHGDKFIGNYTYNTHFDLMSRVPDFPADVWKLIETKTIEPIAYVDRMEASDPEGMVLAADVEQPVAELWSKGVYLPGHLFMYPNQSSGRWPQSMLSYPDFETEYLAPVQVESRGVIASTNNHIATHSRMEIELAGGKIKEVRGGGYYGEIMRTMLDYPGMQTLTWPLWQKPGYWWLYEAGTATNPKYFKHPDELLEGRNTSERNVGGVIHWSFGTESAHGPEKVGELTPLREPFTKANPTIPFEHCCHNHTLMPTYQVRVRDLTQWVTLIEHGRLQGLDDLYVRALASRYGNPDDVLQQDYVPPLPGINVPGNYNDYARDPGAYWVKWAHSVKDGTYKYFKD